MEVADGINRLMEIGCECGKGIASGEGIALVFRTCVEPTTKVAKRKCQGEKTKARLSALKFPGHSIPAGLPAAWVMNAVLLSNLGYRINLATQP